jgi:tetratricopeptide (TPR) repeat protein
LAFLGDYKNALADLDKAIEILPNPRYYVQRSALYAKLGDAQQAGADWATALKLVPNLPDRARIIISSPPQPAERKELTPEELAAFAQVIKAAEHSWSDGRLDVASEAVDAAYRIDPTSGLAVAWRAQVQFDEKHFEEAVASANEAIRLEPDLAQGYLARGAARTALNAPATGIADLTISLRIDPSNAWAWHHRGRAYMVRGQYHQGLADLTKAVEFGGRADHHATRGMCYLHLGDDTKALDDFEQAARLQPANARWRFISSLLKSRLGNPDGARRDLETAFGIDPNVADDLTLPVPMPPVKNDPELPSESKDDG